MNFQRLFGELKRRNVFKVATAYAIAGWLIIQVSDTIFPRLGLPDWTVTFVIVLVLIGFPISVLLAWAFELTPDGIEKSNDVEITQSVTNQTGKKLNRIIITILSITVIFLLTERIFFAESTIIDRDIFEVETASIAVLPFSDLSPEGDQQYFSEGLSEEMLNRLAKVEDLKVAGRMSSYKFKGQEDDLEGIIRELEVRYVLEGSVRKAGNQIRITAKLVDAQTGINAWSESFDRELTAENIFQIQEDISKRVLRELKIRLLPQEELIIEARLTQDIEAYNLYLEATQLEHNRIASELEESIEKYKRAIQLDPTFAEAYARLAFAYALLHEYGNLPQAELIPLMRENIDQALLLDGNLGRAYHSLAYLYRYTGEYEKALTASERAIELMPNDSRAYVAYRNSLFFNQRWDEIQGAMKKAYEIDPLDPGTANMYARGLISDEEFNEAESIFDQIIRNYPDFGPAYVNKGRMFRDTPYGRIDQALELVHKSYQKNRDDLNLMNELMNISMDVELLPYAGHLVDRMLELYPENVSSLRRRLEYLVFIGELEEAERVYDAALPNIAEDRVIEISRFKAQILGITGRYDELETLLTTNYPVLIEEDPDLSSIPAGAINSYQIILLQRGDEKKANELGLKVCNTVNEFLEEYGQKEYGVDEYNALTACALSQRDAVQASEYVEKLYFELNSKSGWPEFFNIGAGGRLTGDHPQLTDIRNRIYEDLDLMKEEMIEYLKAEGEWQEEWGEN